MVVYTFGAVDYLTCEWVRYLEITVVLLKTIWRICCTTISDLVILDLCPCMKIENAKIFFFTVAVSLPSIIKRGEKTKRKMSLMRKRWYKTLRRLKHINLPPKLDNETSKVKIIFLKSTYITGLK